MSFADLAIIMLAHKEHFKKRLEREAQINEGKEKSILNLENISEDSHMEEENEEKLVAADQVKQVELESP